MLLLWRMLFDSEDFVGFTPNQALRGLGTIAQFCI